MENIEKVQHRLYDKINDLMRGKWREYIESYAAAV
jgi:hypothetical protein